MSTAARSSWRSTSGEGESGLKLAAVVAAAGVCSRRQAEALVLAGRVAVDGAPETNVARRVQPQRQQVAVDGRVLRPPAPDRLPRLWLHYKRPGTVVSRVAEGSAAPVPALADAGLLGARVVAVGRLDVSSEGLLLLTDDGALAQLLMRPASGFEREYRARVRGQLPTGAAEQLAGGVQVGAERYGPLLVQEERLAGGHSWLRVVVREGRGREVRRALGHVGAQVSRLLRVRFGPFALPPDMRPGDSRLVPRLPSALLQAWRRFRREQQQQQHQPDTRETTSQDQDN